MDRIIEKKKWTFKKILWIAVPSVTVLAVLFNFLFGDKRSKLNVQQDRITISSVKKAPFQEFIPVSGTVIPIKTIYLDAIEGGRVETIFKEAGSFVKKGDKILKLGNTNLLLDIMYREAELFQQSNNLRNTQLAIEQNRLTLRAQMLELDYQIKQQKRVFVRKEELWKKNLVAEEEFQEARDRYQYLTKNMQITLASHEQDSLFRESQIEQLESSLRRMEHNLEIVKENLDNLTLKAPVTGQLTSLNAEIGESKNRGQRFGQIDVLDGFKVRVGIDEHYISRVNLGQKGEFTFADKDYQLVIEKIYPEVINGRFEVDMLFLGKEPEGIRRGQTTHIRLELGDLSDAILLTRGGFYQKTGGQWVYVVNKSGNFATKREIRLGRQNPDVFEVLDGLRVGDQVITSSYESYGDVEKLILKPSTENQ